MQQIYSQTSTNANARPVEVSKVLRNTYALLAMTLFSSSIAAGISMVMNFGPGVAIATSLGALALIWFVLPRTANSAAGIWVVFGFTTLLGLGLGPTLNYYAGMPGGSAIIMQALGGTAFIFLALSGYVLTTGKNFSFLGGFLFVGLLVVILASLALYVASFFGVAISGVSLALSAAIVFLMSGFILYDTSRIIHGGETNYVLATASMYLSIYNIFVHLLHLISAFSDD